MFLMAQILTLAYAADTGIGVAVPDTDGVAAPEAGSWPGEGTSPKGFLR